MNSIDELARLEHWFLDNADGDWEHDKGVHITTLDNPGWSVSISVKSSVFQMSRVEEERSESDWFHCWTDSGSFEGTGGPENLRDILRVFLDMAEQISK